ncbi:hypothetical protein V1477_007414 [Vespula maculifrons]|uniref:Uncharacterized protein n=1 Tax=Vespula maculifrons TaxID=7453 RepID=A0ABD2CII1_VESMC
MQVHARIRDTLGGCRCKRRKVRKMKSKEEVRGKRIRWVLRRVERKKGYKKEERKKEKKKEEEEKKEGEEEEVVMVVVVVKEEKEEGDEEDEKESLVTPFYEALLETKRNETKRNETKRNETKLNENVSFELTVLVSFL